MTRATSYRVRIMRQRTLERLLDEAYEQGARDGARQTSDWAHDVMSGMAVIHHACEQRDCLEPTHLQAMSRGDHIRLHMGARKRLGRLLDTTASADAQEGLG